MRTKNGLAPQWALVPIGARGAADDTIDIIQVFVRTMREKGVCNERYSERLGSKPPPGAGSATSLRRRQAQAALCARFGKWASVTWRPRQRRAPRLQRRPTSM